MALSKERKAELVKKFGKNEKDTGSIQVQVACGPVFTPSWQNMKNVVILCAWALTV